MKYIRFKCDVCKKPPCTLSVACNNDEAEHEECSSRSILTPAFGCPDKPKWVREKLPVLQGTFILSSETTTHSYRRK